MSSPGIRVLTVLDYLIIIASLLIALIDSTKVKEKLVCSDATLHFYTFCISENA